MGEVDFFVLLHGLKRSDYKNRHNRLEQTQFVQDFATAYVAAVDYKIDILEKIIDLSRHNAVSIAHDTYPLHSLLLSLSIHHLFHSIDAVLELAGTAFRKSLHFKLVAKRRFVFRYLYRCFMKGRQICPNART